MAYKGKFNEGFALQDGGIINEAIAYPEVAYKSGITALTGGTVDTSPELTETASAVDTVAVAADGVSLPYAIAGMIKYVANRGANSMTVFAKGGATINGTAGATGVAQANAVNALYFAPANGAWLKITSA